MAVTVKTRSALQGLVAENSGAIAPGFRVIAAGVRVGRSSIDLVGLDSLDTPALIALDLTGDETVPLKMAEAYASALEDPDSIRRIMQGARGRVGWPPRVIFIAERLSESFLLRLKLLALPAVDCFEYRCVETNGETCLRLDRVECGARSAGASAPTAVQAPAPSGTPGDSRPSGWHELLAELSTSPEVEFPLAGAERPAAPTPAAPPKADDPAPAPEATPAWNKFAARLAGAQAAVVERAAASAAPPEPAVQSARGVPSARTVPSARIDDKVAAIREYLQREFPLLVVYDFYEPERSAHVFQLQDSQGMVAHLAVVTSEFFDAHRGAKLPVTLERMRLGEAMRQAGRAGVRVTPARVE